MARLVRDFTTRAGRKIFVIDEAIPEDLGFALYEYFHYHVTWRSNAKKGHPDENVSFLHWVSPNLIQASPIWALLEAYIVKFFGPNFKPYVSVVNNTRHGDHLFEHRDSDNQNVADVSMLLYLNPHWKPSFSGETVYYDERGEIEFSVLPKFCRLAIHECHVGHASREPSRMVNNNRYTLALQATSDQDYFAERVASEAHLADEDQQRKVTLEQQIFGKSLNPDDIVNNR